MAAQRIRRVMASPSLVHYGKFMVCLLRAALCVGGRFARRGAAVALTRDGLQPLLDFAQNAQNGRDASAGRICDGDVDDGGQVEGPVLGEHQFPDDCAVLRVLRTQIIRS